MHPATVGPYTIERELGRGGMGEVFLARDSRLDRQVAIKALPAHLSQDADRLARFQREAKVLASLNHPGIGAIYGLEEADGHQYLILEFVEGETIADRLNKGQIPVDESLTIAKQIADALEVAHEKGVIHRDLKPANVMVTPDGVVKVLDFGLARTAEGVGSSSANGAADSPTIPMGSPTIPGAIMGTAGYMSPEQARGKTVDKRSDIFSFGCVLYEMLTGEQPFRGETVADVIGATLHKQIDFTVLPAATPPMVRHVLRRCLERDRAQRYRDIADVRIEIEHARDTPAPLSPIPGRRRTFAIGVVGLLIGAGAVGIAFRSFSPAPIVPHDPELRRYTITLPPDAPLAPAIALPFAVDRPVFDLTRDGRRMVYAAGVEGGTLLYVRDMVTGVYTALAGTEGGFSPFFSPDGRSVGYFAGTKLMRLNLEDSERPRALADATSAWGGFWATDGHIYFSPNFESSIHRVSAGGGAASVIGSADFGGSGSYDGYPFVTDDSSTLFYSAISNFSGINIARTVRSTNLASRSSSSLPLDGAGPRLRANELLLFCQGDRLMAVRLDPGLTTVVGEPVGILGGIRGARIGGQWAMSDDGTLVYASGPVKIESRFVWVDREGKRAPLLIPPGEFRAFSLSPDGRRLAVPIAHAGGWDIWLFDLDKPQTPRRITFDSQSNHPIWSGDGRWLLFATYPGDGTSRIEAQDLESSDRPFLVHQFPRNIMLHEYDQAARELFFSEVGDGTLHDLRVATLDLSTGRDARLGEARTISGTPHNEVFVRISPDRRSLAYTSDETGRWEVYVASYPDLRGRIRVSDAGGEEMRWNRDGTKIIYRWASAWYECDLAFTPTISSTPPRVLFKGPFFNTQGMSWDAAPDWNRFLLLEDPEQERLITTLEVVTGFDAEIRRRLPRNGTGEPAHAR